MEKRYYRYELHTHCFEGSHCGVSTAADMARAFAAAGYDGMVLTDHSIGGNCRMDRTRPWEECIGIYRDAYLAAKAAGEKLQFTVLFGWEHGIGHGKELLTYGIEPEFLLAHPELRTAAPAEYAALVRAAGGYIAQAHPFRERPYIDASATPVAENLDGVEIYNASNNAKENLAAYKFAKKHGLGYVSGSDSHHVTQNIGLSGLAFPAEITDNAKFAAALRQGSGRPIIGGAVAETEEMIGKLILEAAGKEP